MKYTVIHDLDAGTSEIFDGTMDEYEAMVTDLEDEDYEDDGSEALGF